ncbi:hypothetical protein TNCV_1954411 [Trichonephila clavipes]|nr:hypothetical protein TNCV_1954411 [Trichonephila clavipes]
MENQHNEKLVKDGRNYLNHFKNEHIPYENVIILVEFTLCCPGSNAEVERVFSVAFMYIGKRESMASSMCISRNLRGLMCIAVYLLVSINCVKSSGVLSTVSSHLKSSKEILCTDVRYAYIAKGFSSSDVSFQAISGLGLPPYTIINHCQRAAVSRADLCDCKSCTIVCFWKLYDLVARILDTAEAGKIEVPTQMSSSSLDWLKNHKILSYRLCVDMGRHLLYKKALQTDHLIGTSSHASQRPMVSYIEMGTVGFGPHGLLRH